MTKNKSLYQILDDNHLIVTEELAKQAKEEILQSLLSLIGDDIKPQWSNEADYGDDETKYCIRCDFMPSEDYDKCECSIKDELRAELRTKVREWVNK